MLYILPTVVLQVKANLYYDTINKTILSFLGCICGSTCFCYVLPREAHLNHVCRCSVVLCVCVGGREAADGFNNFKPEILFLHSQNEIVDVLLVYQQFVPGCGFTEAVSPGYSSAFIV